MMAMAREQMDRMTFSFMAVPFLAYRREPGV